MPASPEAGTVFSDPILSGVLMEFDAEMDRRGYIGHRVFPILRKQDSAGELAVIAIEQMLQDANVNRASGAGYNEVDLKVEKLNYLTKDYGLKGMVDKRDKGYFSRRLDLLTSMTMKVFHLVALAYEKRVAAAVFNSTTWTGATLTTAVGTAWSTHATATPIANVLAASKIVYRGDGSTGGCAQWPNTLVISREKFKDIKQTTEFKDTVKYQDKQDARSGLITAQALADAMDLKQILVAGGTKATAAAGTGITSVWRSDWGMLCYVAERPDDESEPCIGRTILWDERCGDGDEMGLDVNTYEDPHQEGTWVRVRHDSQEKVIRIPCGHLLTNL